MTEVGQYGRLPQGESWRRAMQEVARRLAEGSTKRYRVRGRQIEPGWWSYDVARAPRRSPVVVAAPVDTRPVAVRVAELTRGLPRCAQRSIANHGGNSKVAWTDGEAARHVARLTGGKVYRCQLPAPAIGPHWHVTMTKKKRR